MAISAGGQKTSVSATINVTPMIDVMLVLLIIFMIVTPAITAGFAAKIPPAVNSAAKEKTNGGIRLGIDNDGKSFLDNTGQNGKYNGPPLITDEDLPGQLTP